LGNFRGKVTGEVTGENTLKNPYNGTNFRLFYAIGKIVLREKLILGNFEGYVMER